MTPNEHAHPDQADAVEFMTTVMGVDLEPWQRSVAEAYYSNARLVDDVARTTLAAVLPGVAAAAVQIGHAFAGLANSLQNAMPALAAPEETRTRDEQFARALEIVRTRNTGPARQHRPPRTITARGIRP